MEIPEWLKTSKRNDSMRAGQALPHIKNPKEKFLDKTLRHILSFTDDVMFNEGISLKKGVLQSIEPRLKIFSLLLFIFILSLQKSIGGIVFFLLASLLMAVISRVPLLLLLKRLFPVALITLCIAIPATLNIIVKGEPLLILYTFGKSYSIGPIVIPSELLITKQGVLSATSLFLRVTTSVSIVFLMTMTTSPNVFIKSISSFMTGTLGSIAAISYRYIFLLIKKVEQFIMGFRSRMICSIKTAHQQRWVASRMSLLFSISLRLSNELGKAMESRGYDYKSGVLYSRFKPSKFSKSDIIWSIFSITLIGAMLWKSLN